MRDEIVTTHARLQNQDDLVEELREQLGGEQFNHSKTKIELVILNETLQSLSDQSSLLLETQESFEWVQEAFANSQTDGKQLRKSLADLTEIETGLKAVVTLHGEVLRMKIEIEPLLGEGDLLVARGVDAFNQGKHRNSAIYFDEASQTYSTATFQLATIAQDNAGLVEAIAPIAGLTTISHIPAIFAKSQNYALSDVQLISAKAAECRAAAALSEVLTEWYLLIRPPSDSYYESWRTKIDSADSEIIAGLEAFDTALDLTPDRWQEIKVKELEILEWRALSEQIRTLILGE